MMRRKLQHPIDLEWAPFENKNESCCYRFTNGVRVLIAGCPVSKPHYYM
jgi:hypothetical protein